MERLAADASRAYRGCVYDEPLFPDYLNAGTPLPELSEVNIGSRPARRKPSKGLETLRAIPWQFAWTQTRLILGAWLGAEEAFERAFSRADTGQLQTMYRTCPYFRSLLDLMSMVLAKTDARIAAEYDRQLVPPALQPIGAELRDRLARAISGVLEITAHRDLLEENRVLQRSIQVRNPYVDPINLVQVELLRRIRSGEWGDRLPHEFVVTVNGTTAAMRNAG
jgi:phosphoenolpyruvate carboxylase